MRASGSGFRRSKPRSGRAERPFARRERLPPARKRGFGAGNALPPPRNAVWSEKSSILRAGKVVFPTRNGIPGAGKVFFRAERVIPDAREALSHTRQQQRLHAFDGQPHRQAQDLELLAASAQHVFPMAPLKSSPIRRQIRSALPDDLDAGALDLAVPGQERQLETSGSGADQDVEGIVVGLEITGEVDLLRSEIEGLIGRIPEEILEEPPR